MENIDLNLDLFDSIPGMELYKKQTDKEYIQDQIKIKKFFDLDKLVLLGMEESFPLTIYQLQKLFANKISFAAHKMGCDSIRTNGNLASVIQDVMGFVIDPSNINKFNNDIPYPIGRFEDIKLYVDPIMKFNDNRIIFVKGDDIIYEGEVIDTHGVFI